MIDTMRGLRKVQPWAFAMRRLILSVLGWMTVLIVLWISFAVPPVRPHKVEVLNSPLKPGGVMHVRTWREKVRNDCPISATRVAVRIDGLVVDLPDRNWRGGAAGTDYIDIHVGLPIWMPEGRYRFVSEAIYACPERTYSVTFPVAWFEVLQ